MVQRFDVGTRLSELRFISLAKEAELAYFNIRTVEQLRKQDKSE
jgi:hypothetical protein